MPPARVKAAADAWPTNCPSSLQPCESFLSRPPRSPCAGRLRPRATAGAAHRRGRDADQRDGPGKPLVSRRVCRTDRDEGGRCTLPGRWHRVRRHRRRSASARGRARSRSSRPSMVKGVTVKERASGVAAGAGIGLGAGTLVRRRPGPARVRVHPGTAFPIRATRRRLPHGSVEKSGRVLRRRSDRRRRHRRLLRRRPADVRLRTRAVNR